MATKVPSIKKILDFNPLIRLLNNVLRDVESYLPVSSEALNKEHSNLYKILESKTYFKKGMGYLLI